MPVCLECITLFLGLTYITGSEKLPEITISTGLYKYHEGGIMRALTLVLFTVVAVALLAACPLVPFDPDQGGDEVLEDEATEEEQTGDGTGDGTGQDDGSQDDGTVAPYEFDLSFWYRATPTLESGTAITADQFQMTRYLLYISIGADVDITGSSLQAGTSELTLHPPDGSTAYGQDGQAYTSAEPVTTADSADDPDSSVVNEGETDYMPDGDLWYRVSDVTDHVNSVTAWLTGDPVSGVWTLKRDGTSVATYDLGAVTPFDEGGNFTIPVPSPTVVFDTEGHAESITVQFQEYSTSAGGYQEISDYSTLGDLTGNVMLSVTSYQTDPQTRESWDAMDPATGPISITTFDNTWRSPLDTTSSGIPIDYVGFHCVYPEVQHSFSIEPGADGGDGGGGTDPTESAGTFVMSGTVAGNPVNIDTSNAQVYYSTDNTDLRIYGRTATGGDVGIQFNYAAVETGHTYQDYYVSGYAPIEMSVLHDLGGSRDHVESGSLTIEQYDGTRLKGTYDVVANTGDPVTGSFDVAFQPANDPDFGSGATLPPPEYEWGVSFGYLYIAPIEDGVLVTPDNYALDNYSVGSTMRYKYDLSAAALQDGTAALTLHPPAGETATDEHGTEFTDTSPLTTVDSANSPEVYTFEEGFNDYFPDGGLKYRVHASVDVVHSATALLAGTIPQGTWALKQDGTAISSLDMSSSAPEDSNGNFVATVPAATLTFDANGHLSQVEVRFYEYDAPSAGYVEISDYSVLNDPGFFCNLQSFDSDLQENLSGIDPANGPIVYDTFANDWRRRQDSAATGTIIDSFVMYPNGQTSFGLRTAN